MPFDPFPLTAATESYVPRPAMERALAGLLRLLHGGDLCVRLAGPAGLGKTLLLRLVAERLGPAWRCVYLPYPKLEPQELWAWVADELGARGDPEAAVAHAAARAHRRGGALLLMVDDAHLQPQETRRHLARACAHQEGLRLLVSETATPEDDEDPPQGEVWLTEPMTLAETREYLRERLEQSGASEEVCARFDDATIADLHRRAAGSTNTLHGLTIKLLQGVGPEASEEPEARGDPIPSSPPSSPPVDLAPPPAEKIAAPEPPIDAPPAPARRPGTETPRPKTDREAIEEIARNLPFTFRRPEPPATPPAAAVPGAEVAQAVAPVATSPDEPSTQAGPAVRAAPDVVPLRALALRGRRVGSALLRQGRSWLRGAQDVGRPLLQSERARVVAAGLVAGLLLGAVGAFLTQSDPAEQAQPDARPEVAVEAQPESRPEVAVEAQPESRPELAVEPQPEAPPEVVVEPPPEPRPDVAAEPSPATRPDVAAAPPREARVATPSPRAGSPAAAPVVESPPPPPSRAPAPSEAPAPGRLSVNAIPWASIEIDGEPKGETPLGELIVPQGLRRVVARFPDGRITTRNVHVGDDEHFLVLRPDSE